MSRVESSGHAADRPRRVSLVDIDMARSTGEARADSSGGTEKVHSAIDCQRGDGVLVADGQLLGDVPGCNRVGIECRRILTGRGRVVPDRNAAVETGRRPRRRSKTVESNQRSGLRRKRGGVPNDAVGGDRSAGIDGNRTAVKRQGAINS